MAKINISMDDNLVEKLDNVADNLHSSRSGIIQIAVSQFCNAEVMKRAIVDMSASMKRLADGKIIDDEMKNELAQFESLVQVLSSTSIR